MERIKALKGDAARAYRMALAVRNEDPELWDAACILVRLMAEDAILAAEARRRLHVDFDGHEEGRKETELEKSGDSVSVAEGLVAVERKRKREDKEGRMRNKRRRTSPTKPSKLPVVTRAGRTVRPKKFFE